MLPTSSFAAASMLALVQLQPLKTPPQSIHAMVTQMSAMSGSRHKPTVR